MKRLAILSLILSTLALTSVVRAQENPLYDRINLMASASAEVENNRLIAIVFSEVEDNDQADAADAVNVAISWAADRARGVDGIEIRTMNYNTRPLYANGRRIVGWTARQSLRLESQDAEALSDLLGELQEQVAIQSINYGLSDEARDDAEDALIAEALGRFNRRAELISDELGRDGFRIVRINVGTSGVIPNRPFGFEAQSARVLEAAPTIEAGTQTMTVSVNGEIELEPAP